MLNHDPKLAHFRMLVYKYSSFANNNYSTTQLRLVVLVTDNPGRANCLNYYSYNVKGLVRSVLGEETYAFADGFDSSFMLRLNLEKMVGFKVSLTILTESESLFRIIVKSSISAEKRLMVDIRAAGEVYEVGDISDVGWIRSNHNLSDALTKVQKMYRVVQIIGLWKTDHQGR